VNGREKAIVRGPLIVAVPTEDSVLPVRPVQLIGLDVPLVASNLRDTLRLDDNRIIDEFHYHIFPNSVFNVFAGWYGLIRARPGATHDESFIDMWSFDLRAKDDPERHPRPEVNLLHIDDLSSLGAVLPQYVDILARTQKGLRQPGVDTLRLVPAEPRIGRMHEILDRYIDPPTDQRLRRVPRLAREGTP